MLELLLVLVLLGVSTMIALPAIDRGLKGREARQAALGLAAAARELSTRARAEGVPQQLVLNLSTNSYMGAGNREIQLPADMKFSAVEGGATLEPSVYEFLFFPNGSNLGGKIALITEPASIVYSIRLHPLTGKVEISRGDGQ
jgi:Tfp pilus assembly protein FimT